jgi:hypothetical protein
MTQTKEEVKQRKHLYYLAHKEEIINKSTKYYEDHKEHVINNVKKYYANHKEKLIEMITLNWHKNGGKYMHENKECAMFLGCYVAENILSKEFKNITKMKYNNPGYDYICSKGYKIDVKSACLTGKNKDHLQFRIAENKIANYFLLIGFDNRELLNPLYIWLIQGSLINDKKMIVISTNEKSLNKYKMYERPLTNAIMCCNKMKELK